MIRKFNPIINQMRSKILKFGGGIESNTRFPYLVAILVMALGLLACGVGGTNSSIPFVSMVTRTRLPTLTPTSLPTLTPTPASILVTPEVAGEPLATPVQPIATEVSTIASIDPAIPASNPSLPSPTFTPTSFNSTAIPAAPALQPLSTTDLPINLLNGGPVVIAESNGWSFSNVHTYSPDEGELLLYGELVNETGMTQELNAITGIFYNEQAQAVASETDIFDDWPVDIVPSNGRVPFVLDVDGINSAARVNLRVEADTSDESPHQDFEILEVDQWTKDDEYCVVGELRNSGRALADDLVLAVVLYNNQGQIVNYEDDFASDPAQVTGDLTWDFEICIDPPHEDVTRYELQVWGL